MKSADDPRRDYRLLVMQGYDAVSATFSAARTREQGAELGSLLRRLPDGARVLDLGCGAGVPIARTLAGRHHVVGIDISAAQLEIARVAVPGAAFVRGDMLSCAFAEASFDAVVSMYAVFHTPREAHAALFARVHDWLRPGGFLLATLSNTDELAYTEDFFGAEMYWSNWGMDAYRRMLGEAGFTIIEEGHTGHGYDDGHAKPEHHPLVLAQRD